MSGRVLEQPNGRGLVGAKVFLNDKQVSLTGEGGIFNLENVKTGTYRLTAESGNDSPLVSFKLIANQILIAFLF